MTHSGYILCDDAFCIFLFFLIVKSVRECMRSRSQQPGLQSALTVSTFEVTAESKMDKAKGVLVKCDKILGEEGIFDFIFEQLNLLLG